MQNQYRDLIKLYADREYSGKGIALDNASHSRIRELEILGETAEIGEGEKSPCNPFTLVGAVNPEIVISKKNLANCRNYVYRLNDTIVTNPVATNNILTISKVIDGTTNAFFGVICKVNPNTRYYIKKPAIVLENTEVSITQPQIVVLEYLGKPTNETFSSDYTKTTVINTDGYLTMSKNTEYIVVRVQIAGAYEGDVTMSDVMVSLTGGDYEPYVEQTLPMVGRNLYEPIVDNFVELSDNLGVDNDGYIYLKSAIQSGDENTSLWFDYKPKSIFYPNTKYTFVIEIADFSGTGSPLVYINSTVGNHSYFNSSFYFNLNNSAICKQTLITVNDFSSKTRSLRSLVRINPNSSINALKFRISIYRADDIDLDTFAYKPYKDTFEINSAGSVSDGYNPLTGEYVQRVGKLVLNGTEEWTENNKYEDTNISIRFVSAIIQNLVKPAVGNDIVANIKCSHYVEKTTQILGSNYLEGVAVSSSGGLSIRDFFEDVAGFKSFLSSQYAAGTPVTVYYELAEPITTIINQTDLKANIPDTTISLTEANNLGSVRAVLQTKGA